MSILVTGGAGFIGSHTAVELLNAGRDIVIIDNFSNSKPEVLDKIREITGKDFKFYEVDYLNRKELEKVFEENKIEAVLNFAGYKAVGESVKKPLEYYENNISGALVLLETFVKEIEKDDCDAVIGGYRRITETGKILKTLKLNDGEWSKYMIMAPWAKIYRTQYLIQNDITFLENNLGEDMYFNLKALLLGNVKSIDYVGYNWFFNTKSVSNTIQKNITQLQVFELIDSCYNMLKENGILEKNYEMIEAHFIKYIIWLILFSTKKLDYKTISKEYDKLFNWLKQKFPNYKKNKVVRLWKPKGELFSIRLIVITMSIANKVGLGKVLVYVYSIL